MTAPDFFDLQDEIEDAILDLENEVDESLIGMRDKLTDWATAVGRGELSPAELKELLEGEKALLEMTALKKKVETKVLANTMKKNLIETLIGIVREKL